MKRALLIAYHFPPLIGGSGIQRTLRFANYLPEFGYRPIVLTAHLRAYSRLSSQLLDEVSNTAEVIRAPAWDTRKHFGVRGYYPMFMARPDRYKWWFWGAIPAGLLAIRRHEPSVIWSTYPIATAHKIGVALSKLSGVPLVADFRDPMAQEGYPADRATWRSFARIERAAIRMARRSTFTSPGAVSLYANRYPEFRDRFRLLENGYEESTFRNVAPATGPLNAGRLTLLHSGVVYPKERDPTYLFKALAELRQRNPNVFNRLIIRFRAPVHSALLEQLSIRNGVADSIEILPPTDYADAIAEMCRADGLLVLQASNCNAQIPAKFYEGLRAQRPLLVLGDPRGDTAQAAVRAGISSIAALDNAPHIAELLKRFSAQPMQGTIPSTAAVYAASRRRRTYELAQLFDEIL